VELDLSVLIFHSEFTIDNACIYTNDLCFFLAGGDRYLLAAVLNSAVAWWYLARTAIHGKDEAVRLKTDRMEVVPIHDPDETTRRSIRASAKGIQEVIKQRNAERGRLLGLVDDVMGTRARGGRLDDCCSLSEPDFIAAPGDCVRKSGGRPLAPAVQAKLCRRGGRVAPKCGGSRTRSAPSRSTFTIGSSISMA